VNKDLSKHLKKEDNMSKFIKISELKEKKLKEEEMKNAKGGYILLYGVLPPITLLYGVINNDPY